MNILHTIPSVLRSSAGPSYSVMRLCESLLERNALTLLSSDEDRQDNPTYLKTFPVSLGLKKLGYSPKMYQWLLRSLSAQNFDLVHNHSLWMLQNIYPSWACARNNIPIVISPRGTLSKQALNSGTSLKNFYWPLIQRPALKNATLFHATSEEERSDIRKLGFKQPIAVIPNGIDLPNKIMNVKKLKKLLFLGRIHPIKGIDILLEGWSLVEKEYPEWSLEIVGPDDYGHLPYLEKLKEKLGLKRVMFLKEVAGNDKLLKYQTSSIFILPSHSENFGVSVAEALSNAIPCIVSQGAPWEKLNSKKAGWWIENKKEEIAVTLRKAFELEAKELHWMGNNGRDWMTEEFNWENIALKMQETYRWISTGTDKPSYIHLD